MRIKTSLRRRQTVIGSTLAGGAAAMLILIAWYPIATLFTIDYAPTIVSNTIIEFTPPDNAIFLQNALGALSFPFALLGGIMITGLVGFVAGALYGLLRARSSPGAALIATLSYPALVFVLFPTHMTPIALAPLLAIGPVIGLITRHDAISGGAVSSADSPANFSIRISRRTFLIRGGIYSFGGLLLSVIDGLPAYQYALNAAKAGAKLFDFTAPLARSNQFPVAGAVPEITPVDQFYVMRKFPNSVPPAPPNWSIVVNGLVDRPLTLHWPDLQAYTRTDVYLTRQCVSNPVGGNLISTALMSGARLSDVLDQAKVRSTAVQLVFYGRDGYSESVPIAHARQYGLLVYAMNGVLLPDAHGAPIKVEVPGLYGFKNMKWLTRIQAVDTPYQSVWTQEGWTATAIYQTMSRIDVMASRTDSSGKIVGLTAAGVAFAGLRGISKVEVQVNGGAWQPATLNAPSISDKTWTQWRFDSAAHGAVTLSVRATDGTGALQTDAVHPQFPDGATGWHTVTVTIG